MMWFKNFAKANILHGMKLINPIKFSLILSVFLWIGNACVVIKIPPKPQIATLMNEEICTDELYGAGEEGLEAQMIVIESQEELESLLEKMSRINPTKCSDILMTMDFSEYDLIFILDEVHGTGGFDVEISSVTKLEDLVTVTYKKTSPSGNAATVMTQPYCFQQVEKLNAEVRFELSE